MLRKWHSPTGFSCWAEEITEDVGDDIVAWFDQDNDEKPQVGELLSPSQIKDIQSMWQHFFIHTH